MNLYHDSPFLSIVTEVLRLHGRIRTLFAVVEAATGLSQMELAVLASIAEARKAPTVSDLGRSLGHARQVIQRTANGLLERGLLVAQANPAHKRARVLVLTREGRTVKAKADQCAREVSHELLKLLEPETCEQVAAGLRTVRAVLDLYLKDHRQPTA